jgi:2,3-bisphosphoglycerate-dependent phosphoglycerate mutase
MSADIILVRYTQPLIPSPGGPDDYHRPLTEAGIEHAERLVEDLAQVKPGPIASSPYLRAVQTVEPLACAVGMPVQTGESLRQLTDRATAIFRSLARQHQDRTVVVGSHGTFICRALVGFGEITLDWPFSRAMPMPAIYRIHVTDHGTQATGPGL